MFPIVALFRMAYILLNPQRSPLILNTMEALYQHTVPTLQGIWNMLKWMAQIIYEPWIDTCAIVTEVEPFLNSDDQTQTFWP